MAVSSDGWRPIVGTRRQPQSDGHSSKAAMEATTTAFNPKSGTTIHNVNDSKARPKGAYYVTSAMGQQLKKITKKPVMVQGKQRMPIRGQMMAHSTRNEVFVPPPSSNTGSCNARA